MRRERRRREQNAENYTDLAANFDFEGDHHLHRTSTGGLAKETIGRRSELDPSDLTNIGEVVRSGRLYRHVRRPCFAFL